MLVSGLNVGNDLGIVGVDRVVVDPARATVGKRRTRCNAIIDLKVDQQLNVSGWCIARRLTHCRDLTANIGNRVLTRGVLTVFNDLSALVGHVLLELAVVVNQGYVRQWLSQIRLVWQAHLNACVNCVTIDVGLVINRL